MAITQKRLLIAGGALLLLLGIVAFFSLSHIKAPMIISRTAPPRIRFEETLHELGTVQEGVEIPYIFKIHNDGGEPLIIKNVSTSCGCTVLDLPDNTIQPGKSADLKVTMDTAMKQGYVKKTIHIYSNDPKHPKKTIYLGASVLPPSGEPNLTGLPKVPLANLPPSGNLPEIVSMDNPHEDLTEMRKAKIFTGNCATCHVMQGKGKLGKDLYLADCAMCHGKKAEGVVGPALVPGNYDNPDYYAHMEEILKNGSPTHRSMPGFSEAAGGPLTEPEIQSIMTYLKAKSAKAKLPAESEKAANR